MTAEEFKDSMNLYCEFMSETGRPFCELSIIMREGLPIEEQNNIEAIYRLCERIEECLDKPKTQEEIEKVISLLENCGKGVHITFLTRALRARGKRK